MSERPTRTCRTCGKAIPANRVDCRLCAIRHAPGGSRFLRSTGLRGTSTWATRHRPPGPWRRVLGIAVSAGLLAFFASSFWLRGQVSQEEQVAAATWYALGMMIFLGAALAVVILAGVGLFLHDLWWAKRQRRD